jgi:hypothetical protein
LGSTEGRRFLTRYVTINFCRWTLVHELQYFVPGGSLTVELGPFPKLLKLWHSAVTAALWYLKGQDLIPWDSSVNVDNSCLGLYWARLCPGSSCQWLQMLRFVGCGFASLSLKYRLQWRSRARGSGGARFLGFWIRPHLRRHTRRRLSSSGVDALWRTSQNCPR